MSTIYFNKRVIALFLIVLGIVLWLSFSSYRNSQDLVKSSRSVAHTQEVLYNAQRVFSDASNIELGQRGYVLTGNTAFLNTYAQAIKRLKLHYEEIAKLTHDNISQQRRLKDLDAAIDDLLMFSSSAVQARKTSFESAQKLNASMHGKEYLDRIRAIIEDFQQEENALLQVRLHENESQIRKFNINLILSLVLISVLLLVAFYAVNAHLLLKTENEKRLKNASDQIYDLYNNAPCGYHSLDGNGVFLDVNKTMLDWLGFADKNQLVGKMKFEQIISPDDLPLFRENFQAFKEKGFVKDLEFHFLKKDGTTMPVILSATAVYQNGEFVKTRSNTFDNTARKEADLKIKSLNQELEAFTYSVSHDLRAPLRSIDGYSKVLQEDYGEKLDDEGKRVIRVIINNARRMGRLIDDLLEFSRLGKKEVSKAPVDMTPMIKSILIDMLSEKDSRQVEVKLEQLLPASVDVDMIRQVWINLISNAIKYSGKVEKPVIHIRSYILEDEICYEVADNGVGFDMTYSSKLFGVFQRLHKIQDFEGTGVGLAIVKRIISRHNGRVWAHGAVNAGATFCFTLPAFDGK